MILYNVHSKTLEYLVESDSEARQNPRYTPETHDPADQYQYNRLTSSLIEPPATGENEVARLIDSVWEKVADFRGKDFWNTATKQKHSIVDLGIEPDPDWTDQEPTASYQVWDGAAWINDFDLWLEQIVRQQRDIKMDAFEWRVGRHERDIRLGLTPTDDIVLLDEYMQALADFPAALSEIVDPIPWPTEPV